ncbi:MAG: hypothetical protein M1429_02185 [Patescibacteria group bacterium]|nr:hypothetical protein [Patescibacteria group bacterium]
MKKIGIDASGGDHGLSEIIPGAVQASKVSSREIVVYGNSRDIKGGFCVSGCFQIVHCERPNDELAHAFSDLEKGYLDAIVTASNSRRLLVNARDYHQNDVPQPGLIAPFPIKDKTVYMLDVGATARVPDPKVFLGWANVGSRFLTDLGIKEPKIGLLNIAQERAYPELAMIHRVLQDVNGYVGYAEPKLFAKGEIDLWLMEGFIGNAFLKLVEEILPLTFSFCHRELADLPVAQSRLHDIANQSLSYDAHLVSPLLGLKGKIFRVHGCCQANQIAQSFRAIEQYL